MIVKMKKIYMVVLKKETEAALKKLRHLGSIHVEDQQIPTGEDIDQLKGQIALLQIAIAVVDRHPLTQDHQSQAIADDWKSTAEQIVQWNQKAETLKTQSYQRQQQIDFWTPWGDFNPKDLDVLKGHGIYFDLFQITLDELKKLSIPADIHQLAVKDKTALCVAISNQKLKFPFETLNIPSISLSQMIEEQKRDQAEMKQCEAEIAKRAHSRLTFQSMLTSLTEEFRLKQIAAGMGQEEMLSYLKGYCPMEEVPSLEALAKKEHWGLVVEDPSGDDKPPSFLKNPSWVKLVNPVFDFMSIIPGYHEADVSFCFLFFFSIFFGMLIGDAGYGALFFLFALFLHPKLKAKKVDLKPLYLIYVLSFCAIVWGVLTGTVFGVSLFGRFIKPAMPWLGVEKNVQLLCFTIGTIHLTIAHVWRGLRKLPSVLALADAGWIMIVWVCYFYAQLFILSKPVPEFVNIMAFVGFGIIVLFGQSIQDVLKDIPGFTIGILLTVLTIISTLIDVISYIRLYAVGSAGLALAESFNQMALASGFQNLFLGLLSIFILVAGHTLNIILGVMAIMVHGLRLNILEFSGHLSMEWSGVKYSPFKKERIE